MGILTEQNNGFSWKKALTLVCCLVFFIYNVNIVLRHNPSDLPVRVTAVLVLVFGGYFGKQAVNAFADKMKARLGK